MPLDLGKLTQLRGALAHLGDRAGGRIQVGKIDGLDRIHDQKLGLDLIDMVQDDFEVGFGHQQKIGGEILCTLADARGAHLDLPLGFFTGDIQHTAVRSHFDGHLQHQRGFANARIAADEHNGAWHDAAAQHAGELPHGEVDAFLAIAAHLADRPRVRPAAQPANRGCSLGGRLIVHDLFDHAVERAALRAFAHIRSGHPPAFLADVASMDFWHSQSISEFMF